MLSTSTSTSARHLHMTHDDPCRVYCRLLKPRCTILLGLWRSSTVCSSGRQRDRGFLWPAARAAPNRTLWTLRTLEKDQHRVAALESAIQEQTAALSAKAEVCETLEHTAAEASQQKQKLVSIQADLQAEVQLLRQEVLSQREATDTRLLALQQQHTAEDAEREERHRQEIVQRAQDAGTVEKALQDQMQHAAQQAAAELARQSEERQYETAQLQHSLDEEQCKAESLQARLASSEQSLADFKAQCAASAAELEAVRSAAEKERQAAERAAEKAASEAIEQRDGDQQAEAARVAQAEAAASELRSAVADLRRQVAEGEQQSRRALAALRSQAADDAMQARHCRATPGDVVCRHDAT